MTVMTSVLESALTVSPWAMSTETTVPLIGLVNVASFSDCSALVRSASAVSMAAWSDAICWGVSASAPDDPVPPLAPAPDDPVPPVDPVPVVAASVLTPVPVFPVSLTAWLPEPPPVPVPGPVPVLVVPVVPPEDSASMA